MDQQRRDVAISEIYKATTEPDGIARIAGIVGDLLEVDSVGFWLVEQNEIVDLTIPEDIAASTKPYLEYYQAIDPWTVARRTPGVVSLGSDMVDEQRLVRSEFYNDFARHYGMLRPMGLVLDLEPGLLATFALNRTMPGRLLDASDKAVFQGLAVHLHAALTLRSRIAADRRTDQTPLLALDQLSFGIVVCDADTVIHSVNQAALDLAAQDRRILIGGRGVGLAAANLRDHAALRARIEAAAVHGLPGAMRIGGQHGASLSVLVTPSTGQGGSLRGRGYALVCLRADDAAPGVDASVLSRLFGLSPAQAALCVLLLQGRTIVEAANERGIATTTARTHVLAVLERTRTRDLRDLLRLLSSLPPIRS